MPQASRKILTVFPNDLLSRLDELSRNTGNNRSELIRRSVARFLDLKKELSMIEGYERMGEINLKLAEEAMIRDSI
ncbi:MAG: ribbon-helix-helix domain-containing protein [Oscillospiraceae bacterium]|nr:ribbon-helix-helix domain-containing protein [Oscillospiraceae bacterium]